MPESVFEQIDVPTANENYVLRNGSRSALAVTCNNLRQIDQPYLNAISNGLSHLINRMTGQPLYAHISLEKGERSELADLASSLL